MKLLFDECLPKGLAESIPGHSVKTVPDAGWSSMGNGELLTLASDNYDVFVTLDEKMASPQIAAMVPLPVVVLKGESTRLVDLEELIPDLVHLLENKLSPGVYSIE